MSLTETLGWWSLNTVVALAAHTAPSRCCSRCLLNCEVILTASTDRRLMVPFGVVRHVRSFDHSQPVQTHDQRNTQVLTTFCPGRLM